MFRNHLISEHPPVRKLAASIQVTTKFLDYLPQIARVFLDLTTSLTRVRRFWRWHPHELGLTASFRMKRGFQSLKVSDQFPNAVHGRPIVYRALDVSASLDLVVDLNAHCTHNAIPVVVITIKRPLCFKAILDVAN
jgi:hypothetical protein